MKSGTLQRFERNQRIPTRFIGEPHSSLFFFFRSMPRRRGVCPGVYALALRKSQESRAAAAAAAGEKVSREENVFGRV